MTNPDNSEHVGVMNPPFIANDGNTPAAAYLGSGMLSLYGGSAKLGPYRDAQARHQVLPSRFHRSSDFCGSCHDVSNPVVGDLAHNNGRQPTGDPVLASGQPGSALTTKAAFRNFPFQYGVVERTFSEFKAGMLSRTLVKDYASLPDSLKAGAIRAAYESARGNYADGTPRYFSCQTCHMRAVTGQGCNKAGAPVRTDLPLHDMTGGNYWVSDAIIYLNDRGLLRLGGGLTQLQKDALRAGAQRARQQLKLAASLSLTGNTVRVTNLTGHKLITGYPEGRRMWLNIKWYGANNSLLREDGAYGDLTVQLNGQPRTVRSLLDLSGRNTKIYEAHYAMTREWASQLLRLGYPTDLPLSFDRSTGAITKTLGQLAGQLDGSYHETFHFVLNNHVAKDNRIPPYGMSYEQARKGNALPVPEGQYGSPGPSGVYQHYDEITLNPPAGAVYATIDLLYQPTSWEYVQFLYLANKRNNPFLAEEGARLLEAWLNTGMAEPFKMASVQWGSPPTPPCAAPGSPAKLTASGGRRSVTLNWSPGSSTPSGGFHVYYAQSGKLFLLASVPATTYTYLHTRLSRGVQYCYQVTAWNDCNGNGVYDPGVDLESAPSNQACATAQ